MTDEEVVRKYGDMVYRIAIVRMKTQSEAEDVFQEVFLRYIRFGQRIRQEEHLKAWLIRVTINCCNNAHTSQWKRKTVSLEERREEAFYPEYDEGDELLHILRKLPEQDREVIHLFYYEEYSVKEIGKILRKSEGAIKTRLSRARDKLRDLLQNDETAVESLLGGKVNG